MAGRQCPVFFLTLIMDILFKSNLSTFSAITSFSFPYKNNCTFKVARKNKTVTVENTCTRRLILHIYKANNLTFKRKKAILDEHFSAQYI